MEATLFLLTLMVAYTVVQGNPSYLLVSRKDGIDRYDLDGTNKKEIIATDTANGYDTIMSLAYDKLNDVLFYSVIKSQDTQQTQLRRCTLEGQNDSLLSDAVAYGMAPDSANKKLYYTAASDVKVVDYDGTNTKTLVADQAKPQGLALNAAKRTLYWADGSLGTIHSVKVDDGTDITTLRSQPQGAGTDGMDVALSGGPGTLLYWADKTNQQITAMDVNSKLNDPLLTGYSVSAITALGNYVYFTEGSGETGTVRRMEPSKEGKDVKTLVEGLTAPLNGIATTGDSAGAAIKWSLTTLLLSTLLTLVFTRN